MFLVLFLHCLWGLGTTEPFFQIIALVYSLLSQTEGKSFLWKEQRRMVQDEITPNDTYFFMRLKKFYFCEI